jgi:alpha-beta hydrolase superfamily lysophospholipase
MTIPPHQTPQPETVLLIGGPCATTLHWQGWMSRYTARGYSVIATAAPLPPSDDRLTPRDAAQVATVIGYYERLLLTVPQPPILIGHCYGGVIVQLLVDRGHCAAGIALNPPPSAERRNRARVFGGGGIKLGSAKQGRRTDATAVDYRTSSRAPLLLVGGGADRSVPPESVEATVRRYWKSDAVTGYLKYPDGCHHTLRAPGWEHVADDVLDWAELHADHGRLTSVDLWNR